MEEINNISEPIQILMDSVKKDIFSKTANKRNKTHNKEIINSLFNLLDYQITLMNQILVFNINNKDRNDNRKNIDYLIKINKDILVSMINKFVTNINSIFNKEMASENKKQYINNRSKNPFEHGKLNIQNSTTDNYNNNYIFNNSYAQFNSPIKKNMEKEFNSAVTLTQQSSAQKIMLPLDQEKNSYRFIQNKNILYSMKKKPHKDVYEKLYHNTKCDHEEKKKNKFLQYQAYSKSMKDLFVDLKDDNMKKILNKANDRNNSTSKKIIKEQLYNI